MATYEVTCRNYENETIVEKIIAYGFEHDRTGHAQFFDKEDNIIASFTHVFSVMKVKK